MKKLIISALMIAGFAFGASAQKGFDRSYSTANYKHPNKARKAAELNLDKNLVQAYNQAGEQVQFENYKNSFAVVQNNGGVLPVLPVDNSFALASARNYKVQFSGTNRNAIVPVEKSEPVVLNSNQ